MELIKKTNFDFLGIRKYLYVFSLTVIIAGGIVFAMRGKGNFGVDFVGGDLLQVKLKAQSSIVLINNDLKGLNLGEITVQEVGTGKSQFIIKSPSKTSDAVVGQLRSSFGADSVEVLSKSAVSPAMSKTLKSRALLAFFGGLIAILIYLAIRFEFHFGLTATLATLHDLLFVVAVVAFTGRTFDTTLIAALLTIAGYSSNDTIVIFDRIRENIRKTRSTNYYEIFNQSINETLSRTVLTVCTVLFVDLALFFFGGEALHSFAFSLLIGFIIGAYSSIFIASALLIDWQKKAGFRLKV